MEHRQYKEPRHFVTVGRYIADFVYGANDGIITTFAIIAASAGAGISTTVILILGFANLVADGFSMAISDYLGIKSRHDFELQQKRLEEEEIEVKPEEELQELRDIYSKKGFKGTDLERAIQIVAADKKVWVHEMLIGELGIIPEEYMKSIPFWHAVTTFFSFALVGLIPLLPYLFGYSGATGFYASTALTALGIFAVGGSRVSLTGGGFFKNGFQMLLTGGLAAIAAYLIGFIVRQFTGFSL